MFTIAAPRAAQKLQILCKRNGARGVCVIIFMRLLASFAQFLYMYIYIFNLSPHVFPHSGSDKPRLRSWRSSRRKWISWQQIPLAEDTSGSPLLCGFFVAFGLRFSVSLSACEQHKYVLYSFVWHYFASEFTTPLHFLAANRVQLLINS